MKSIKNDNPQLLLDLFRAYFDARKNKRQTANALAFEKNYEEKLFCLYEDIINRRYEIGRSICFVTEKPVKREIFAADFRDRIVHHLIFNYVNHIFESKFIRDSYSCRTGKGTSDGIRRLDHFIRSCSDNYKKDCWILKLDIKGYFMSMDRNILYRKIKKTLEETKNPGFDLSLIFYLIHKVIFNDPTKNCRIKGKRENWVGLPKSKSLFFAGKDKGFPIGNLTSQLFGNVYLDDFDHYVREKIGLKRYGRYVDDMVFVDGNRNFLKDIIPPIENYLKNELVLGLHDRKKYLQRAENGVGFLGTFIKPYRKYIGRRTKNNFYAKSRVWNKLAKMKPGLLDVKEAEDMVASLNSYLGIMKHYATKRLRERIVRGFDDEILRNIVFSTGFEKAALADIYY